MLAFAGKHSQSRRQGLQLKLSPQQTKVCELIAAGLPDKEIAIALGLSYKTVKCHALKAYKKLGARNRTEAARILGLPASDMSVYLAGLHAGIERAAKVADEVSEIAASRIRRATIWEGVA